MLTLQSVRVKNIRALGDVTIEPLPSGMTALNGESGTGKTTVFAALLWALFGTTPAGVPVAGMRRQGTDGEECYATVTFIHDNQTIEVTRQLKGAKDTTVAKVSVDGIEQAVSAKGVPAWVQERLGIDVAGFKTAIMVGQKELDGLVTEQPAPRRKLIERLAGIERLSTALQAARQEANQAATLEKSLPGSEDELAAAKDELATAQAALNAAITVRDRAENEHTVKAGEADTATAAAAVSAKEAETANELVEAARTARSRADVTRAAADAAAAELSRMEGLAGTDPGITVDEARARAAAADTAVEEGRALWAAATEKEQAAKHAADRLAEATARRDKAAARAARYDKPATKDDTDLSALLNARDQARMYADKAHQALGGVRAAYTAAQERLDTFRSTNACPTCAHTPDGTDAHDKLGKQLTRELAALQSAGPNARTASENADKTAREADRRYMTALQHSHGDDGQAAADARSDLDAANTDVAAAQHAAQVAATELEAAHAARDAVVPADRLAAQQAAQKALQQAQSRETMQAQVDAARDRATTTGQEAAAAATAAQEAITVASTAKATLDRAYADAQAAANAQQAAAQARHAADLAGRDVTLHDQARNTAQQSVDRAQAALDKRAAAVADREHKDRVAASLAAFREERLARLAPEMSDFASKFLASMTDGKYVRVDLDDEFTAVVTDADGWQRPQSYLSGGEVSAVAMALRLAIGEIVTGGRGGLLILDEALTAQDAKRRAAMFAEIRSLGRQVVTINHLSEATDMVDQVYEFQHSTDDSGSYATISEGAEDPVNLALV